MRVDPGMVPTAPGDTLNNYGHASHVTALVVETGGGKASLRGGFVLTGLGAGTRGGMEVTAMDLVHHRR